MKKFLLVQYYILGGKKKVKKTPNNQNNKKNSISKKKDLNNKSYTLQYLCFLSVIRLNLLLLLWVLRSTILAFFKKREGTYSKPSGC